MTTHDLIIQRPATPSQLVLLFHGVGSSARDLAPLGEALAPHLPGATIVSLQAPEAAGPGWQWFSVQGVTEGAVSGIGIKDEFAVRKALRQIARVLAWHHAITVAVRDEDGVVNL